MEWMPLPYISFEKEAKRRSVGRLAAAAAQFLVEDGILSRSLTRREPGQIVALQKCQRREIDDTYTVTAHLMRKYLEWHFSRSPNLVFGRRECAQENEVHRLMGI